MQKRHSPPTAAQPMLAADLEILNQVTPETSKTDLSRIISAELHHNRSTKSRAKIELIRKISHRLFDEKIDSGLVAGCEIEFLASAEKKAETKCGFVVSIQPEKKVLMVRTEKGTKLVSSSRIISFEPCPVDKEYSLVAGYLGASIKKGLRGERFQSQLKEVKAKNSNLIRYFLPNPVLSEALEAEEKRK